MYKLNIVRLLNESENIEKSAIRLEDCLNKLNAFEASVSALNSDEELTVRAAGIKEKLEKQQQIIRRISYVLSCAANTVVLGNKQALSVCDKRADLQKALVSNMLGNNSTQIDPTTLPIMITISN